MSQSTVYRDTDLEPEVGAEVKKYQIVINGIAMLIPEKTRMATLVQLLSSAVRQELHQTTSRPEWTKQVLRIQGDAAIAELVRENWEHMGQAATVQARFGIPGSTLHRLKDRGEVIAFRPAETDPFVFPLDQFEGRKPAPWAADIVKGLGNGAPALHFIFTPRGSLGNRSLMDLVRAKDPEAGTAIHRALRRLTAE
ncbi:hypothetical protein OPIT5_06350 [Opitutaceae bacterium TAV5]|nr:hypothetical protein OPIT5_06350 [Opitutaceae bacterium TAV5]